jgi:hypothetical protein
LLLESFVLAAGPVNRAHAARSNLFHQQIGSDPLPLMSVGVRLQKGLGGPVRA